MVITFPHRRDLHDFMKAKCLFFSRLAPDDTRRRISIMWKRRRPTNELPQSQQTQQKQYKILQRGSTLLASDGSTPGLPLVQDGTDHNTQLESSSVDSGDEDINKTDSNTSTTAQQRRQ
jgi:hypothetical protein